MQAKTAATTLSARILAVSPATVTAITSSVTVGTIMSAALDIFAAAKSCATKLVIVLLMVLFRVLVVQARMEMLIYWVGKKQIATSIHLVARRKLEGRPLAKETPRVRALGLLDLENCYLCLLLVGFEFFFSCLCRFVFHHSWAY